METSSRLTPLRLDREDEKKMLPCRFFVNGYCHKGNRCRFYHPLNVSLSSMIRIPPLPAYFGGQGQRQEMRHSQQQQQHLFVPHPAEQNNYQSLQSQPNIFQPQQQGQPTNSRQRHSGPPKHTDRTNSSLSRQNTVFSHIDWSVFLAPGETPPPPTHVPDERHSPSKKSEMCTLATGSELPSSSSSNEDMPPEGRVASQRKLTAKEELHMKVQEIAKELAEEPLVPIHSLDSFFRNFTLNV